jgi:hypothetical protein
LCDGTTKGVAEHVGAFVTDVIEDHARHLGDTRDRIRGVRSCRPARPGRVERDDLEPVELFQERAPGRDVGSKPVDEQERRALTVDSHTNGPTGEVDVAFLDE